MTASKLQSVLKRINDSTAFWLVIVGGMWFFIVVMIEAQLGDWR